MKWNIILGVLLVLLSVTLKVVFSSHSVFPYNYFWSISFAVYMVGLCYVSLYFFRFFKVKGGRVLYVFLGAISYEVGKHFYGDEFNLSSVISLVIGYFVFIIVHKCVKSSGVVRD